MDFIDMWPHEAVPAAWAAWTQGVTDALGWSLLISLLFLVPLIVLFSRAVRRRRFWCVQSRREVEVVLEEHGLPGFRHAVGVRSCSVFDPPTAVTCHRRCLDADCRRPWDPELPIRVVAGQPGALRCGWPPVSLLGGGRRGPLRLFRGYEPRHNPAHPSLTSLGP